METSPNRRRDSKESLTNTNGIRQQTITKQTTSRVDRSLSRNQDDNETNIIRSNTPSSLTEQAKPDELASGKNKIKFSILRKMFFLC
jgi:hypothetical protein